MTNSNAEQKNIKPTGSAGGAAGAAGYSFQALIGARIAARMLSEFSIGSMFGIEADAVASVIRFETEQPIDDIQVQTPSSGRIHIQAKTSLNLSSGADSTLAGVFKQFVRQWTDEQKVQSEPTDRSSAFVLAVSSDASKTITTDLAKVFRQAGTVASLSALLDHQNADKVKKALNIAIEHIRQAHQLVRATSISDESVLKILQLGRVLIMPNDVTSDVFDAERNELKSKVLDATSNASSAFAALRDICLRMCADRSGGDAIGFRSHLALVGVEIFAPPTIQSDIDQLLKETERNLDRESDKTSIRVTSGAYPVDRIVLNNLWDQLAEGSVLVTGEPGCGKTGILVSAAERWQKDGKPMLFLSVDRHAISTTDDLRMALQLRQPLLEVLRSWENRSGLLVIDALDAARGGDAERVFRNLIQDVLGSAPGWTVCASIRSFDLDNSRIFKEMSRTFTSVKVTDFSKLEMQSLMETSPQISAVLKDVSPPTLELLRNPFNLQLAVEVVELGNGNTMLSNLTNQAGLLTAYWQARLPDYANRQIVESVVLLMIEQESLVLHSSDLSASMASAINAVLPCGVLVNENAISTKVAFRHHILFDFAASVAKFGGSNLSKNVEVLNREIGLGFVLAPALRFHLQRIWDQDSDRATFWNYVVAINGHSEIDPIARAASARSVVELVGDPSDIQFLLESFKQNPSTISASLQEIIQEARLAILANPSDLDAWAALADGLLDHWGEESLYPIRLLLVSLSDAPEINTETFQLIGSAARKFLLRTLSVDAIPAHLSESDFALRVVAKTYSSNVQFSRKCLELSLLDTVSDANRERHIETLCRCVNDIIDADAEFAAKLYGETFATPSPDTETTLLGNSQIMPLMSTRKQDFESCFWSLGKAYERLWSASPIAAVHAVVSASRSHIALEHPKSDPQTWDISVQGNTFKLTADYSFIWASKYDDNMYGSRAGDVISNFSKLLRSSEPKQTIEAVNALLQTGPPALLWSRVFSAAAIRTDLLGDILWPLLRQSAFFECSDTCVDAVDFLEAVWVERSQVEKNAFELALIESFPETARKRALAAIPIEQLGVAAEAKRLLEIEEPLVKPQRTSFTTTSGEYDWVQSAGVNVDSGVNSTLRAEIETFKNIWTDVVDGESTKDRCEVVKGFLTEVDHAKLLGADWRVLHEAWSALTDRLQKYFAVSAPPELEMFGSVAREFLLTLSYDINPEPNEEESEDQGLMSWGSPAPRLDAAAALILVARQKELLDETLKIRIAELLHDPVPTVRLQIAQSLNTMWETDRDFMWELIDDVAQNEVNKGVLNFYIGGTLGRIMHSAPERVGSIVQVQVESLRPMQGEGRDRALESAADLLSILWFWRNWQPGKEILEAWLIDMSSNEVLLWHAISQTREGLIAGIVKETNNQEQHAVRQRTQVFARATVSAAQKILNTYRSISVPTEGDTKKARSAAKILDHVVMEIYFACGAYSEKRDRETQGLADNSKKLLFLNEMSDVLLEASAVGTVHTLHQLLEILEFLMSSDPAKCIDMAFSTILDSAEGERYAIEQMGADLFVRIIRTSLADYRDLYGEKNRRARLLDALDRFLQAGSPEARQLLHELPDALR